MKLKERQILQRTSPSILYDEKHETNISSNKIGSSRIYFGTEYTFDKQTGNYNISNLTPYDLNDFDLNEGENYYTFFRIDTLNNQPQIYKIINMSKEMTDSGQVVYDFTYYTYSQIPKSYDITGVGMYANSDDDGMTYYYRGSTSSNYVKFAGFYWRVIRVNEMEP